jgi:hypothetical protein
MLFALSSISILSAFSLPKILDFFYYSSLLIFDSAKELGECISSSSLSSFLLQQPQLLQHDFKKVRILSLIDNPI